MPVGGDIAVVLEGPGRDTQDKLYGIFRHTGALNRLPDCEAKKLAVFTEESMRGHDKKPVAPGSYVKGGAYLFSAGVAGKQRVQRAMWNLYGRGTLRGPLGGEPGKFAPRRSPSSRT